MPIEIHISRLSRKVGKTHAQIATNWLATAAKYGFVGGLGLIWATEWKLVGQYIPYWGAGLTKDEK